MKFKIFVGRVIDTVSYIDWLGVILYIALAVSIITLITQAIGAANRDAEFDKWQGDCRSQNGLVVKVSENRYECYINGKKQTLEGYEQYA